MRILNIVRFSHFKSAYLESIKTTPLRVTNGKAMRITRQERTKNTSYESSQWFKGYRQQ